MASFSGLWNGVYGVPYTALDANNTKEVSRNERTRLTKLLSRERGTRKLMALMRTLNGIAPGSVASMSFREVLNQSTPADPLGNGGKRTIVTRDDLLRTTTAADVTMINEMFNTVFGPSPYPVDESGNGGGGKRNAF